MKKILLATTILAASAGFASADIAWSGSAAAGIASDDGADMFVYSTAGLKATLSGQTDSGLSFGTEITVDVGTAFSLDRDAGDSISVKDGTAGDAAVFVSGSFGKLSFKKDGFSLPSTDDIGDVSYEGTFGSFTLGLMADVDAPSTYAVKVGTTLAGITLSADADTLDAWDVSASYTMGAITASAGTNEASETTVGVAYSANGVSAGATYNTSDESVDLSAGYAAGAYSVKASYNTGSGDYEVTGSYDLGGGLSLNAGANDVGDMMLGASMSF